MRERRLLWTILSLTLIVSIFSAFNVQRVNAVGPTVSISPAANAYDPGQQFTISINIASVVGLNAWELKLKYSPGQLYTNYSAVEPPVSLIHEGSFLNGPPDYFSTFFAPPYFGTNYVQLGDLITSQDSRSGSGTLVTIGFVVKGWGYCNLEIFDLKLLDVNGATITPSSVTGGTFRNLSPNVGINLLVQANVSKLLPGHENQMYNVSRDAAYKYKFNVTVWNTGPGSQTFDVKFYYNSSSTWDATADPPTGFTQIGSTQSVTLGVMSSQLVQFSWDPAGIRAHTYNYTLTFLAKLSGMSGGDAYADDNTKPLPLVVIILMGGDCNWTLSPGGYVVSDGRVNYKDLGILAVNYGKKTPLLGGTGDPRADFNADGYINYKDLGILAVAYGKTYS